MKILYTTTVGLTMGFFNALIHDLIEKGHTVDIACNESEFQVAECYRDWGCQIYPISWTRSPLSKANAKAIKELKDIVEENVYDIVHCHTPVAAVCTRLACKKLRKSGLKVFYTAHGFHFYKGAPIQNWLLYYPVEWLCSFWTDTLITINHEDFARAKKHFYAKKTEYVPGVGVDVDKFKNTVVDRAAKRKEIGVPEDAFLLLSVGELNKNKNHQIVIKALAKLNNPKIHYIIAGEGLLKTYLLNLARDAGVFGNVHLLGRRSDVAELYKAADVCVFPSIREGLGLAALEGMASGLPLLGVDNRGTREYVQDAEMLLYDDVNAFVSAIQKMYANTDLTTEKGKRNIAVVENYSIDLVRERMEGIYGLR